VNGLGSVGAYFQRSLTHSKKGLIGKQCGNRKRAIATVKTLGVKVFGVSGSDSQGYLIMSDGEGEYNVWNLLINCEACCYNGCLSSATFLRSKLGSNRHHLNLQFLALLIRPRTK
jgi:hypothetical protein